MATDINSDIQKLTGLWNAHGKNDHIKPIADMDKQEVLNLLCIILELYESSWSWNVENNVENRKRIQSCLRRLNLDYLIKGSTELEGSNSKVTRLVGALWEKLQQKYGSGGLKQRCLQVQMKRQKQYQQKQEKSVAKRNEEQVCETYVVFSKQSLEKSSLLELQKEEQFSSADSQDLFIDRKIPSGKELPRTPVLPLSIEDSSENLAKIKKADEEPQDNVLEVLSTPVAVGQILLSGKQDQVTLEGSFVLTAESQRVDAEIRTHKVEHTKNSVNKISPNETQIDTPIHFDKSDLTRLNQKDLMIGSSTVYTKDRKIPKGKEIPRTPIKGVSVQTISEKKLYNSLVVEPQSTPKSRHELKTYTHVSQEIHQLSQQDLRLQSLQLLCQNNEDFSSQISECDSTETKQLQPNDRAGEQTFRCQSKSPVLKSFLRKSNVSCINGEISHTGNIKVVEEPSVESCRLPSRVNQLKRRENNSIYASENTEIQNQLPKIKEESGSRSKLIPSTKQQEQLEARKKESVEPDDSSVQKTLVEEDKTSTVKSKAHHDNFVDQHSNSIVDFEAYNSSDAEEDSQLSTCPSNTVNLNQTFTIEDDTSFLKNKNIRRISEDVPTSTISSGIGENNIRKIETDDSEKFGLTNGCHSKKHKVVSTFSLKGQNLGKETENKSYVSDRKQIQCESPTGSNLGVMYKESSVDVNCMGRKDKTEEELETFSLLKESTRHISSLVGKPNNRGKKKYEPSFVNQSLLQTADISEKSKSEQKQVTMSQGNNVNTIKGGKLSKPKFNIIPEHEKTNELNIIKKIESSEVGLSRNESELASKKTCVKKTKNICTQLSTPEQGMKMIATRSKTASRIIKNTCSKVVISPDHDKTQTLKRTQQNTDSKLDVEYDQEKLETTEKKQSTNEELFNANNKNKVKQERKSRKTKQNAALELNILKEEKSIEQRIGNKEIIGTLQDTSNKVDFVNNQEKAANGNQMLVESVRKTTQNSKVELTSTNPKETSEISIKTQQDIKPELDIKDDHKKLSVGKRTRTARRTHVMNVTELDSTKDQKRLTFTKKTGRVNKALENREVNLDITHKQENLTQHIELNTTDVLQTTGELDNLNNRNNLNQENKVGSLNKIQISVLKAGNTAGKENMAQRRRGRSSKTKDNENPKSDVKLVPSKDAKFFERNEEQPLLKMNQLSQTKLADLAESLDKLSTSGNTEADDLVKEFNELQLTLNPNEEETAVTSETERRRLESRLNRLQLRIKLMEKRSKLLQSIN